MYQKIVLIGAGSAQFGFGTLSDIFVSKVLEGSEIALHDINPQALDRVEKAAKDYVADHNLPFTITATTDRKVALRGANFCIISIEVGDPTQRCTPTISISISISKTNKRKEGRQQKVAPSPH